jgi:hypothetical protein
MMGPRDNACIKKTSTFPPDWGRTHLLMEAKKNVFRAMLQSWRPYLTTGKLATG